MTHEEIHEYQRTLNDLHNQAARQFADPAVRQAFREMVRILSAVLRELDTARRERKRVSPTADPS